MNDKEYLILILGSLLKVIRHQISLQEIASIIVENLGIYDAAEIATEIQKVAETIPNNETERE